MDTNETTSTEIDEAPQHPYRDINLSAEVQSKITQAIGSASMCWAKIENAGEFDSEKAEEIARDLCSYIQEQIEAYRKPWQHHYELSHKYFALLETAWGIIANAYGGDWDNASPEWREAAERWREKYHGLGGGVVMDHDDARK